VDLAPHFEEVHRANMTKLAGPKREDGKQLKPEGWQPPDHDTLIIKANHADDIWNRYLHGEELHPDSR
jgi:predicted HAD superfamily Cof-like phosphohydrolase